jgi:gas vesicle protein GvpK
MSRAKRARRRVSAPRARAARPRDPLRLQVRELKSLRAELAGQVSPATPRWNADPEDVQRSVAKLVLTLVEFLRQLMERQAIRRMESDTLTPAEVEAVGLALMRLEETLRDLATRFDLTPADLNLDLGPLGRLL